VVELCNYQSLLFTSRKRQKCFKFISIKPIGLLIEKLTIIVSKILVEITGIEHLKLWKKLSLLIGD